MRKYLPADSCPYRHMWPRLSYLAADEDARRRMAEGQEQTRCAKCLRYRWADQQALCPEFVRSEEPNP